MDVRVEDAAEVAGLWRAKREADLPGALLLCVPPPEDAALPSGLVEELLEQALRGAKDAAVTGKALTPYLLAEMSRLSEGRTLETNVALLRHNARVAARVAAALAAGPR